MSIEKFSCAIVGAGVVGLAAAFVLRKKFRNILVCEKHTSFGRETSSRNSEVIHAGIYYPAGSLKARLCVEGNRLLYAHAEEYGVPYKRTGKLIAAFSEAEGRELEGLMEKAVKNGVTDVKILSENESRAMEPELSCTSALLSPSTGIIDSHALMASFESAVKETDSLHAYGCEVKSIEKSGGDYILNIRDADGEMMQIAAEVVINAAGLYAGEVAGSAGFDADGPGYRLYYSRGEYYKVNGVKPWHFKSLVYPTPDVDSLGIHIVLDLRGGLKLGPNAYYVDDVQYDLDERCKQDFFDVGLKYLPGLKWDDICPDMAGIRPKLQAPGVPFADFGIYEESGKGYGGFVNLMGIESPGLTSCLAIARHVEKLLF
ncbi:MAG: NAD(P)/FAD-dependent oxidoreductase [Spirochaetales bacterium]|nr:NAD(P)/FAD-dependent oxidoreductase [Spirochaetales bacterium]